jgi:DNA-binding Xre family transcriptional regulator
MLRRGITQYRWTKDAGVPKNILRNLFVGDVQTLDYTTLRKLAAAVSCTVPNLTGGDNVPEGADETMRGDGPGFQVLKALLEEQQRQNDIQTKILETLGALAKALRVEIEDPSSDRPSTEDRPELPRLPRPS